MNFSALPLAVAVWGFAMGEALSLVSGGVVILSLTCLLREGGPYGTYDRHSQA